MTKREEMKELNKRIKHLRERLKYETCWINKRDIRKSIERIKSQIQEANKNG